MEELLNLGLTADILPILREVADAVFAAQPNARSCALIARGWPAWYAELFGQRFVDSLDSLETDDKHHSDAIQWHWEARLALLRGERPPNDWFAYFPTWSRGHMKSWIKERMIVTDAALSSVFSQPGFALDIGREKQKIQESIANIEVLLSSPKIKEYFPSLSRVKRNEETNQKRQWTGTYLHTAANYIIKGGTIESAQAGARAGSTRPTFLTPDDIDSRDDSPVITANILRALTTEILPMGQENTLTFWAQNLISRYSARYQIESQQVRVLTNRKPSLPIPAVRDLITEPRTVDGYVRDIFISGRITWRGWNRERVQDEINREGLPSFLRENQHEVDQTREGLAMQHWNDSVHVISRSQFAAVFGAREMPFRWFKYMANDWARTKTKFHANVTITATVSGQNSPVPGCVFLFNPMSFPAGSAPEDVAERLLGSITKHIKVNGEYKTWRELIKATLTGTDLESITKSTSDLIERRRSLLALVIPALVRPLLMAQNYQVFRVSHERKDVRDVYRRVFGLPADPCNPGGDGGVDTLNLLTRVDYDLAHPFKPGEKGYANCYLVGEDDLSVAPVNVDGVLVYPPRPYNHVLAPDALHDEDLLRFQMANWRWRDPYLTSQGEKEGELLKLNDDFGNALMFLCYDGLLRPSPLTYDEKLIEAIPEKHRVQTMLKENEGKPLSAAQQMTAWFNLQQAKGKVKR